MQQVRSITTESIQQEQIVNRNQLRWAKLNEIATNVKDGRRFSSFYDLQEVVEALAYRDLQEMKRHCAAQRVSINLADGVEWATLCKLTCRLIIGDEWHISLQLIDSREGTSDVFDLGEFITIHDRVQGTASLCFENSDMEKLKPCRLNGGAIALQLKGEMQVVSSINATMELPE